MAYWTWFTTYEKCRVFFPIICASLPPCHFSSVISLIFVCYSNWLWIYVVSFKTLNELKFTLPRFNWFVFLWRISSAIVWQYIPGKFYFLVCMFFVLCSIKSKILIKYHFSHLQSLFPIIRMTIFGKYSGWEEKPL